ncbi:MAG: aspartyl protease family protein [Verrucomicrobiota bacterium]|nr:aspartyl protease family protein [Verrucomicrobiota bacterium]
MRIFSFLTRLAAALLFIACRAPAATEIPFDFQGGMIWLKVAVVGQMEPLSFLLDSGAGASVVDVDTARCLGLKLGRSQSVQGVHTRSVAYRVDGFRGAVSGVPAPSSVLALDLSSVSNGLRRRIDGLLGADFLRERIVQIDYAAQRIAVLSRNELNIAGAEILPLARRNDGVCVRVSIAGQAGEWMRVDTGCNSALQWVMSKTKARKLGPTSVALAGKAVRSVHASVRIGSSRFNDVETGLHTAQIFPGEAGLLGNGLLSRFTVTIDVPRNRLILAQR